MSAPLTTVVYGGLRYPVTGDVANTVIYRIETLQTNSQTDFVRFPTTDGREVVLRLGQGVPIAFET